MRFTPWTFVLFHFLGSAASSHPLCQGLFETRPLEQVSKLSPQVLQELAKLRVDSEEHPSSEMREFIRKMFEAKLKEVLPTQGPPTKTLKDLNKYIEQERARRTQVNKEIDSRTQSEEKILNGRKLKIRHTHETSISPSNFGTFQGDSVRGSVLSSNPIYSGEGIVFSRNEQFAMLRPKATNGQCQQAIIFDLKERKQLKYAPFRGFFSTTSDYFAELKDGNQIQVVNVRTEKVIATAVGDPLWPDSKTFTNHFLITANKDNGNSTRYTLHSFQGGVLDLGTNFAVSTNGRILYVQDHKIKCVDGRTLNEIPVPAHLAELSVEPDTGHSSFLKVKTENEDLHISANDFSYYKDSQFPAARRFADRFLLWEDSSKGPLKTRVYDLKTQKQFETDKKFYFYEEAKKTMIFQDENHQETVLLKIPSFKAETFPGLWTGLTEDGKYLYKSAWRLERTKVLSVEGRIEHVFGVPGAAKYLRRHQQWIVTVELPDWKGHQQAVIEDPESIEPSQVISDAYYFGVSKSGRYLTVGNQGRVQLLELADPVDPE